MSEFKVGDRVYFPVFSGKIFVLNESDLDIKPMFIDLGDDVSGFFDAKGISFHKNVNQEIFHVTPENHALLSQLYPNVEFEKPKAVGSDLTRQMLAEGAKEVLCWVSDESDEDAITEKCVAAVVAVHDTHQTFVTGISCHWLYAVPIPRNHYTMDDSDE